MWPWKHPRKQHSSLVLASGACLLPLLTSPSDRLWSGRYRIRQCLFSPKLVLVMELYHSNRAQARTTNHLSIALKRYPNNPKEERFIWGGWFQAIVKQLCRFGACGKAEYHSRETWNHEPAHLLVTKKQREKGARLPLSLLRHTLKT